MSNTRCDQLGSFAKSFFLALLSTLVIGPGEVALALPLGSQIQKLVPSDGRAADESAVSVSLSGNVSVLGAHLADARGTDSGAAYIYNYNGASWSQSAKFTASDGAAGDRFGTSVSVDGNFTFVGASMDDDRGVDAGSVYVYRFNGSTWTQTQKLLATDGGSADNFGSAVAVSGNYALIAAIGDGDAAPYAGAAYVFRFDGTNWVQAQKLLPVNARNAEGFGKSLSVSGTSAIVGAYQDDTKGENAGAAYMYRLSGTTWVQQTKLVAADGAAYQNFGNSVSVAGTLAVVGAPKDDDRGNASGSAYIFRHNTATLQWNQEAKLTDPEGGSMDQFGTSASISGDAAAVGAPWWEDHTIEFPIRDQGAVVLYRYDASQARWSTESRFLAGGAVGYFDNMSNGVAVSGGMMIAGANKHDALAMDSGAGYVFDVTAGAPAPECLTNADCNDSNPCTTDVCSSGSCQNSPAPTGTACNDGLYCNGADSCSAGACTVHAGNPCTTGSVCANTCNEAADNCFAAANTACTADTNSCTNDVCNGSGLCTHPLKPAGSACGNSTAGLCDNPDTCNASGVCVTNALPNGATCADDGNECTNDTCSNGQCTHPAKAANTACTADTNACTNDVCNGSGLCTHPLKPAGSACGSSSAGLCDNPNTCSSTGVCLANNLPNGAACADDGNECTSDTCSAGQCIHPAKANSTPCDDGNLCTDSDVCTSGVCRGGSAVSCDDSNPCTVDACDPKGCRNVPLVCPTGQTCSAGVCVTQNLNVCNNGLCDAAEDECNCPEDCATVDLLCGNGVCDAYAGEDCRNCPGDCRGRLTGPANKQFCCGDEDSANPTSCTSTTCNYREWSCTTTGCDTLRR